MPSSKWFYIESDCAFSILEYGSNKVRHSAVAPTVEVTIGHSTKDISVSDFISPRYLDDQALTLQVDAILMCYTDEVGSLNICELPEDNIRDCIKSLHLDQQFADMTIACRGKEFKVHRAILVSQSPVFKRMLAADMTEKRNSIVKMTDISSTALSDLITYFYTGSAPNASSQAKELLAAANKYELPRLQLICERELRARVGAGNAIEMLLLAEIHQAETLKRACLEFIKSSFGRVYESDGWKDLRSKSTNSTDIYTVKTKLLF